MLDVLLGLGAFHRHDLANRRLPPAADALSGSGHLNLQTVHGPLDVLCELDPGRGYEELAAHTNVMADGSLVLRVLDLPTLIEVKTRAGRAKDKFALPLLLATLEERR